MLMHETIRIMNMCHCRLLLLLLFKLVNDLLTAPSTYMLVLSPLTTTRAQCNLKNKHIQISSRVYQCSFFPRTVPQTWRNNLRTPDTDNFSILN